MTAVSADADGEDPGVDRRLLDAHLAGCPGCRAYRAELAGVRRHTLVASAPEMPDLSRRVTRLNAAADRASRWGLLRALLALVALEVFVLALPDLVLGEGSSSSAHVAHAARHLGSFSIAYAVALALVVIRPARARAILPVTMVLAGALVVTAVADVVQGRVPLVGEVSHVPEVLSVGLVWMLARPSEERRLAFWRRERKASTPRLQAIDEGDDR